MFCNGLAYKFYLKNIKVHYAHFFIGRNNPFLKNLIFISDDFFFIKRGNSFGETRSP